MSPEEKGGNQTWHAKGFQNPFPHAIAMPIKFCSHRACGLPFVPYSRMDHQVCEVGASENSIKFPLTRMQRNHSFCAKSNSNLLFFCARRETASSSPHLPTPMQKPVRSVGRTVLSPLAIASGAEEEEEATTVFACCQVKSLTNHTRNWKKKKILTPEVFGCSIWIMPASISISIREN